ncbi:TraQ conjugal transfer family protein [Chryseobacterium wanjuense]
MEGVISDYLTIHLFVPNDFYLLTQKEFRLYYTSESTVSQSFDIWIQIIWEISRKPVFSLILKVWELYKRII